MRKRWEPQSTSAWAKGGHSCRRRSRQKRHLHPKQLFFRKKCNIFLKSWQNVRCFYEIHLYTEFHDEGK